MWFWEKQFSSIDAEEVWCLESTYEEDELLQALSSMNSDTAPGPNGFIIAFFFLFKFAGGCERRYYARVSHLSLVRYVWESIPVTFITPIQNKATAVDVRISGILVL